MKIIFIILNFISFTFLIVYGILSKKYMFIFNLLLILYFIFIEKEKSEKNTLKKDLFESSILLIISGYYFLSLFGISNKIVHYLLIGFIIIYLIYLILRKILDKTNIKKSNLIKKRIIISSV